MLHSFLPVRFHVNFQPQSYPDFINKNPARCCRINQWLILSLLFFSVSCANKVSPSGGPQDKTPPESTSANPPNYTVNFKSKEVSISFNEFIQLNDIQKQLVVSPLIEPAPEISVKRKSVIIKLPGTLKQNTTYTMNFGDAIADIHEGNVARGFQYVFSTGPVLDSLMVSGNAFYAENLKTEHDVLVMLYADSAGNDSVPYTSLPSYFAKTDSSGNFRITNISPGFYKLFALRDGDQNYKFNRADEAVAFQFAPIEVPDSNNNELRLFIERPKQILKKTVLVAPGKILATFSNPVFSLQVRPLENTVNSAPVSFVQQTVLKDTCILWVNDSLHDSLQVVFYNGTIPIDTARIRIKTVQKKGTTSKGELSNRLHIGNNTNGGILQLRDSFILYLPYPITEYDLKKIVVMEDSVVFKDPEFLFDSDLKMNLMVNIRYKQGSRYDIFIPPATFTSYNGLKNDSTKITFRLKSETEYGSASVKLTAPDIGFEFVLLVVDENDNIIRKATVKPHTKTIFAYLDPGQYRLKIIYDGNGNKRWDTGKYLEKLQPERVYYYSGIVTVRANWDIELEWVLTK